MLRLSAPVVAFISPRLRTEIRPFSAGRWQGRYLPIQARILQRYCTKKVIVALIRAVTKPFRRESTESTFPKRGQEPAFQKRGQEPAFQKRGHEPPFQKRGREKESGSAPFPPNASASAYSSVPCPRRLVYKYSRLLMASLVCCLLQHPHRVRNMQRTARR